MDKRYNLYYNNHEVKKMPKWAKILIGLVTFIIIIVIGLLIYINVTFISKEEVKEQLASHIKLNKDEIYFENIDLEIDNNQYEVDFYYNNNEYEAKIDAKEGKIIYTNYPLTNNSETPSTNNETTNQTSNEITLDQAKEIALKHANLNEKDLTLIKAQEDQDDGKIVYDIEWHDTIYEYDFEISKTGEILHYDKDKILD